MISKLALLLSLTLALPPLFAETALSPHSGKSQHEQSGNSHESEHQEIQMARPVQADSDSGNKRILDLVRKGVVVVDVKTYASTESEKRSAWTGSGFIVHIDEKEDYALIATNRHVAGEMTVSTYNIKFSNGTTTEANLVYFDPLFDFAFLKVEKSKLPKDAVALELSDKPLEVNESVYTMGNSSRDEFSTYKCTIFSLYEMLGPFADQSVRFSGLTVQGASGSPGFDENGKVVLIVYGGKMTSGAGLPIGYVRDALDSLKKKKNPSRRSIGIVPEYASLEDLVKAELVPVSAMQEYLNAFPDSNNKVLIINSRIAGTDARSVFEAGDILWKVNGTFIGPKVYDLDKITNKADKDEQITVSFYRKGELKEAKIKSYHIPSEPAKNMIVFADATWVESSEFIKLFLGHKEESVFMLGVGQTSPFRSLFNGDLPSFLTDIRVMKITEMDGKPIKKLSDLAEIIPSLMKKREFTVKYIDFMGMIGLGVFASADREERLAVVTYESKFDAPKFYAFNDTKNEWDSKDLGSSTTDSASKSAISFSTAPSPNLSESGAKEEKSGFSFFKNWTSSEDKAEKTEKDVSHEKKNETSSKSDKESDHDDHKKMKESDKKSDDKKADDKKALDVLEKNKDTEKDSDDA